MFSQKKFDVSIIASKLAVFPGHKLRLRFIDSLLSRFPDLEMHTFGKGREQVIAEKVDGLRGYRYSIAIENSQIPSYITEKFFDCIIAGCVPLYYGAPNAAMFFPNDCYIPLPIEDLSKCCDIVGELSETEYERRLPALIEAQSLIQEKYSMGALILEYVDSIQQTSSLPMKNVFLFRFDGFICSLQKFGIRRYSILFLKSIINFLRPIMTKSLVDK